LIAATASWRLLVRATFLSECGVCLFGGPPEVRHRLREMLIGRRGDRLGFWTAAVASDDLPLSHRSSGESNVTTPPPSMG
jgi:hypothetical protein